jgi:diacylglycerol kinase (ATP)
VGEHLVDAILRGSWPPAANRFEFAAALRMKSETLVIVNPVSGGGWALRAEPLVASYLAAQGRSVQFVHSHSSEDVREQAAKAAVAGYRYVVALGGDGTFHNVVEGVYGTDSIAGIFPAGNGNDIARDLGIPGDPVLAADIFLHSQPRALDLIRVRFGDGRTVHYAGVGGMGLDAEAAHLANTQFKAWPGVTRYLAGTLWTFFRAPALELRSEMDGIRWAGRALFAAVANATSYGSGVRIAPEARMDDGWLDVVIVGEVEWTRLIEAIPILLTTGNLHYEEVKRFRCKRVRLEAQCPAKVHGDGELLGESPAEFEVIPGALRVMAPRERKDSDQA